MSFEHGSQFLDGLMGFTNVTGKWEGYRDDLVDEGNAFIAGFEAEPVGPSQNKFLNNIQRAATNGGLNAVVAVLNREGPYRGRSAQQTPITTITPSIYAVPRRQPHSNGWSVGDRRKQEGESRFRTSLRLCGFPWAGTVVVDQGCPQCCYFLFNAGVSYPDAYR